LMLFEKFLAPAKGRAERSRSFEAPCAGLRSRLWCPSRRVAFRISGLAMGRSSWIGAAIRFFVRCHPP
jgi:hypothetical protein